MSLTYKFHKGEGSLPASHIIAAEVVEASPGFQHRGVRQQGEGEVDILWINHIHSLSSQHKGNQILLVNTDDENCKYNKINQCEVSMGKNNNPTALKGCGVKIRWVLVQFRPP